MERLSNYRAKEANEAEGISQKPIQPKKRTSDGTKSISDILNKMSK